jgi:glutathione S-transferase
MAVHVLLNELGQPVTLVNVADGDARQELLKINPRGQVPTLVDDGQVIREGAAIILHLLGKHSNALLPESGKERASALEWLMFANATLHPAYARGFFALKNFEGETQKKVLDIAVQQINKLWEEVESRLTDYPYLAGKQLTAADVLLTVIANWSGKFNGIKIGEKAKALFRKVIALPSYQKALKTEAVEYKAAA